MKPSPDTCGEAAIFTAIQDGDDELERSLLSSNPDCATIRNQVGLTPFMVAARRGIPRLISPFFACASFEAQARDTSGRSALLYAIKSGNAETVQLMLANCSVDVEYGDSYGTTPLSWAIEWRFPDIAMMLLTEWQCNGNAANSIGRTPLLRAAHHGFINIARYLLENASPDLEAAEANGSTSLCLAAAAGHAEMVTLLLSFGAKISAASHRGWTPLDSAVVKGHCEVAKVLLQNGADPSYVSVPGHGWPALHLALDGMYSSAVELLLQNGANHEQETPDGIRAVDVAAMRGFRQGIELLVSHGASVGPASGSGVTPLQVASAAGDLGTVEYLSSLPGLDLDATCSLGATTLYQSSAAGHAQVVRQLLRHSASTEISDKDGFTPALVAARNGHSEVLDMLLHERPSSLDDVDIFGRNLLYWVKRIRGVQLRQVVCKYVTSEALHGGLESESGVAEPENDPPSAMNKNASASRCSVCTGPRNPLEGRICTICRNGDFGLCSYCYEIGAQCDVGTHELEKPLAEFLFRLFNQARK